MTVSTLRNLAPEYPRFSGSLRYTAKVTTERKAMYLDLGVVGELASVTVNGISCGSRVSSPFQFHVADAWSAGENTVEILVATNTAYAKRDMLSSLLTIPPSGLLGPIRLSFASDLR